MRHVLICTFATMIGAPAISQVRPELPPPPSITGYNTARPGDYVILRVNDMTPSGHIVGNSNGVCSLAFSGSADVPLIEYRCPVPGETYGRNFSPTYGPQAVSDDGLVVVGTSTRSCEGPQPTITVGWVSVEGEPFVLDFGHTYGLVPSFAEGVTPTGDGVLGRSPLMPSGYFYWTLSSGVVDLATAIGVTSFHEGWVCRAGVFVFSTSGIGSDRQLFRWTPGQQSEPLGSMPRSFGVQGWSRNGRAAFAAHGVWSTSTGVREIATEMEVLAVSDDGAVAGGRRFPFQYDNIGARIWTPNMGVRGLETIMDTLVYRSVLGRVPNWSYSWRNRFSSNGFDTRLFEITTISGGSLGGTYFSEQPNYVWTCPPLDLTSYCRADINLDGSLDPDDLADFIIAYFSPIPSGIADWDGFSSLLGGPDPDDLADYITAFFNGCD